MSQATVTQEQATTGRWRNAFAPSETVQRVRPKESFAYLPNPHRGTTTFQRFNGDALNPGLTWNDREGPVLFQPFSGNLQNPQYPNTTLAYCRWLWSVLEPEKGKYRWEIIDGSLEAARLRGQTVQMRVQPYIGEDAPPWYLKAGGTLVKGSPRDLDHNNPAYLKHFGGMIKAFGKRYDGHPGLESFDMAYGGVCGEMGGNATPATARKLVDVYRAAFKKTTLISMLGTAGCAYASKFKTIGWRGDCYGDMRTDGKGSVPNGLNWNHMFDEYPKMTAINGVTETWKTAPVTFETCWTVGYWQKQGWDIDWILEHGLKYHVSVFMPKSSFIPDEWREKIDAWDRKLGYRFVLRQMMLPLEAKPGAKVGFHLFVDNVGVAPIYRPYQAALRFRQGQSTSVIPLKQDIRSWLPGYTWFEDKLTFPKKLQRGECQVDIGIIDPKTQAPRVLFAIEPPAENGWHPLCRMDVV